MATDKTAAMAGRGPPEESKESLMEQVAEYVRVSKETSKSAYDLACMAQDLGSLWSSKRRQEEASVAADAMISNIVGDRKPYTFGKRGSDTIPSGLAALSHFLSEDPRHFGVRLSTLFTGSNFIQERRKVAAVNMPIPGDSSSSSDESEFSSSSPSSGSTDSAVSSLSSEEMNNFDAGKWYQKVDKLVSTLQSKSEWETIAALRDGYSFKDSERAADLVHVEALADLNDEELRIYEQTKEKLETQVESKQLEILSHLTTFSQSLKRTTREVIARRRARRRVKKKFSFSNMDEVRFVVKDGEEDSPSGHKSVESENQTSTEVDSKKGHRAGELLTQISGLQSIMNELVRDAHLKKQTLDVNQKALSFLEGAMEAAEKGVDPPEPDKDIEELLHKMQAEAKEQLEAEQRQATARRLQEVNADNTVLTEELLKDMDPKQLKVHLTQFENDVDMLQRKVQEMESARIAEARGGPDRSQRARKAALMIQQPGGDGGPDAGSRRNSLVADPRAEANKNGRASPAELRRRLLSGDVPPPSKMLSALEEQVPAAKQAVAALDVHKALFFKSVEKAKELKEKYSLDMKALRRSFLAGQEVSQEGAEPEPPPAPATAKAGAKATSAKAQATPAVAVEKRAEATGAAGESPRRRRSSRAQVRPPPGTAVRPSSHTTAEPAAVAPAAQATPTEPSATNARPRETEQSEPASTAPAPAPTESPRMAPRAQRHTAVEGLPEGTAQQMKALKEATKAYNRAHHEAHRLGKLLDVNLEEISEVEAKVMLHAQQLGYNKKQARIEELEKELLQLQKKAGSDPSAPESKGGRLSPKSTAGSGFHGEKNPTASHRMDEFQKAKLDNRKIIEELLKMEGAMNPELLKELLHAQGENLHIQEQLVNLDEVLRLLKAKGKDLSKEEKAKIKGLLGPTEAAEDPSDPQVQELRNEKRRMRGLQKEVKDKRGEWSGIEGVSQALQGLGEGVNPFDVLRKVRMINAATARQNSSEENSPANRTSTHPELATLQAAAMAARVRDARNQRMEEEGFTLTPGRTPRTPGATSAAQLLRDAVSAVSAAKAKAGRPGGSRRASAADLVSLNVPMHVAINLRRRQSLAAGMKAAAQDQSNTRRNDAQVLAISTMSNSSQANTSSATARPQVRNRRATDAEVSPPPRRHFAGTFGRRVSIA